MTAARLDLLLRTALFALTTLTLFTNAFLHPDLMTYDAFPHAEFLRIFEGWTNFHFLEPLPDHFEHGPTLFYVLFGKWNHIFESFFGLKQQLPFLPTRVALNALITIVLYLYFFFFVPKFWRTLSGRFLACVLLVVVPNFFVISVMPRPDVLLFIAIQLLFFFWFQFDFHTTLWRDRWKAIAWGVLLVIAANSRNIAFPAAAYFGIAGLWQGIQRLRETKGSVRYAIAAWLLLAAGLSTAHYIARYQRTGSVIAQARPKDPRPFDRWAIVSNLNFAPIFKTPSRRSEFPPPGLAFWPVVYSDMWGDHLLYFSGHEPWDETKKILKRRTLGVAGPLTLLLLFVPFVLLARKRRRADPHWLRPASFLWVSGFLLVTAVMIKEIDWGNTTAAKYGYYYAYGWFPGLVLAYVYEHHWKHARWKQIFLVYVLVVYIFSFNLCLYPRLG